MFGSCYSATLPRTCLRACVRASLDTSANNRRKQRSKRSQLVWAVYFWDILTALHFTVHQIIGGQEDKEAFAQGMDENYLQFLKRKGKATAVLLLLNQSLEQAW